MYTRAGPYYLPFQISPGPSPLTRTPGQDYQMPSPLPIPSPTISGWSPHSPPRPQVSRTQSYAPGFAIQQPDLLRPVTAPSLSRPRTSVLRGSPSRAFPNLPSLASITERREDPSSRPRPNRITLPAIQDPQRTSSIASSPGPSRSLQLSQTTADYSFGRFSSGSVRQPSTMSPPESSREPRLATASSDRPPSSGYFSSGRPLASAGGSPSSRRGRAPFLGSPTSPLHEQTFYAPSESSAGYPRTPELPRLQLPPTANCSRVLVGSLYSICQKLQDENGQQGLFFFAHDLGVRTEGRFTLKFTLVNLIS